MTSRRPAPSPGRPAVPAAGTGRDTTVIHSLDRGLRVLDAIVGSGRPVRLRDVAGQLRVDKASAFRLLATLERFGLVAKDPRAKTYGVGSRLLAWVATQRPAVRLTELVRPHLVRLVAETEESGHLGMLGGDQVLLVDYVPSAAMVTIRNRIGVHEPLYCTAVGKALLAFLPAPLRRDLVRRLRLRPYTARTVRSAAALDRDLERVRETGIALDRGEYHELVTCVAAPILDPEGYPVAAVGISSVTPLLDRDPRRLHRVTAAVRACAARVTRELAGVSPPAASSRREAPARLTRERRAPRRHGRAGEATRRTTPVRSPRRTGPAVPPRRGSAGAPQARS